VDDHTHRPAAGCERCQQAAVLATKPGALPAGGDEERNADEAISGARNNSQVR